MNLSGTGWHCVGGTPSLLLPSLRITHLQYSCIATHKHITPWAYSPVLILDDVWSMILAFEKPHMFSLGARILPLLSLDSWEVLPWSHWDLMVRCLHYQHNIASDAWSQDYLGCHRRGNWTPIHWSKGFTRAKIWLGLIAWGPISSDPPSEITSDAGIRGNHSGSVEEVYNCW